MAVGGSVTRSKDASSSESTGSKSASGELRERGDVRKQLRKTKLCVYHFRGACQFGADCAFAHSAADLEATPDLRKTRICKLFQEGKCNDADCTFAHGGKELRNTDAYFKKTLCIWNERGKCRNGDSCQFAHGMKDLCLSQALAPSAQSRRKNKAHKNAAAPENQMPAKSDKPTPASLSEPMFVPIPGSSSASTSPSVGSASTSSVPPSTPSRQSSTAAGSPVLPGTPVPPLLPPSPTTPPPEVVASAMASAMEAAKIRLQALVASGAQGAALENAVTDLQQHTSQLMAQCSTLLQQQQQQAPPPGLGQLPGLSPMPPDRQLAQFMQFQGSQLHSIHGPKVAEPLWTYGQAGLGIWGA